MSESANTLLTGVSNKRFISFEGIDGSGKSTQIQLLKRYLEKKGFPVYILREPGGTEISEKIRSILLDKEHSIMHPRAEVLLYSAARVQLTTEKIIPLLKQDYFVIADRFYDSTSAYQGYGRELEPDFIRIVNDFATLGLNPGITFYLKLDTHEASKRRKSGRTDADRLELSGEEFYCRVIEGYERIAKDSPQRIQIIDASQDIEQIHRKIIEIISIL